MSKSQIIFGYQIATVLSSDNHDVVIIRPDINPYIYEFKPGKFREIQLNALKSSGNAVFEEFRRVRDESIFGDQTFLSGKTIGLPSVFYKLMTTTCLEIISSKSFLDAIKAENFDFLYLNHHQHCALAVAEKLKVRHAIFSSANLRSTISRSFGIPQIASVSPAWFSSNTDQMNFIERAQNLFILAIEASEDLASIKYDDMYRQHFGANFPSSSQLFKNVEIAFINDEELFNYPRPISHKIVYIGGLGEELSKHSNELSQEYNDFIADTPTILVSFGSVANSSEMPKRWEEEFKKLFEMYPEMKFIWKYDGKDVDYPSNVLIKDWIPQTELLKSGKITLFLTHGGYNSLSESLYAAVPMLLIPLFADQPRNANLAKKRGVGLVIQKSEIQADFISLQIKEILGNSSYHQNSKKYQRLLNSKPFKAQELVIRWNRFLLENEPVDLNIKSMNFIQYYCLDILVPLSIIISTFTLWLIIRICRLYYWSCFGMGKKPSHLKKE